MIKKIYPYWFMIAVIITSLCGLIYTVAQQTIRLSANQIPAQIIDELASSLNSGEIPQQLFPTSQADISQTLIPIAITYDQMGNPIAASGLLNGKIPTPPKGVFDYVRKHGEDRFTWQPSNEVRLATIIRYYSSNQQSGYILVSQSLKETEHIEDKILQITIIGWAISMILTFIISIPFLQSTAKKK